MVAVIRRLVGALLVLAVLGTLAHGQDGRGALGGVDPSPAGPRAPLLAPDVVGTALIWSAAPESAALRERWLSVFQRSLAVAAPGLDLGVYDADDLCGYIGGSGGTSKLDGGGWLATLNPRDFDQVRDPVTIDVAAALFREPPVRLVVIDEFELQALAFAIGALQDRPFAHPFVASGLATSMEAGLEVAHGHLVAHHVAALLNQRGFRLSPSTELQVREAAQRLRLTFERDDGTSVAVDLYDAEFDRLESLEAALVEVAVSASIDGPAAVVLSWGLTGCALRDSYTWWEARPAGSASAAVFPRLSDFAVAVTSAYDGFITATGAIPVTRTICDAVSAFSRSGAGGSDDLECGNLEVRASVATTVLFASYAAIAEEALGGASSTRAATMSDAHLYFAAAGNDGLPYPMPPASFDGIVAVAACKPTGPERAWFSNEGDHDEDGIEAIALGAWFPVRFRAEDLRLGYWGTSFAAPLAALASALGREADQAVAPSYVNLCEPARTSESP